MKRTLRLSDAKMADSIIPRSDSDAVELVDSTGAILGTVISPEPYRQHSLESLREAVRHIRERTAHIPLEQAEADAVQLVEEVRRERFSEQSED